MVGLWQVYGRFTTWHFGHYLQLDKWDTLRQATTNPVWSQDCHPGIVQHSHLWSHNFYGKKPHNLDLFTHDWLVVYLPLWKIWVRHLGWWHSQSMESHKIPWFQSPPISHLWCWNPVFDFCKLWETPMMLRSWSKHGLHGQLVNPPSWEIP